MKIIVVGLSLIVIVTAASAQQAGVGASSGAPGQWWSEESAGRVGGIGGTLGTLGGVLGALSGWLAPQGKARRFIMTAWYVAIAIGIAGLAAGLTAIVQKQPYVVYYPLLLGGFVFAILFGSMLPTVRRRYEEAEMRKMSAQDAGGSTRQA